MTKSLVVPFVLLACAACQIASPGSSKPVAAGALSAEYQRSIGSVRNKYDGREILVRGYAKNPATMPQPDADQGLVFLQEKESQSVSKVICWFSREQAPEFSKIKGDQFLTVRGIFNGERGVELKFCKLVKIE
jgi:putative nucleic acid binding protein